MAIYRYFCLDDWALREIYYSILMIFRYFVFDDWAVRQIYCKLQLIIDI